MIEVAVLLLECGHLSTAIGPLEIFREAGVAWSELTGGAVKPRFRVRSASIDKRPVRGNAPYAVQPDEALAEIESTDLVFVPSGGTDLDASLERNRPVIDFLQRMRAGGARIAGVCSGVALLAASGMLDGKKATSHWGLLPLYRERFPDVDWQPEALVTESDGVYCGAGVYAALDLALYLVEKLGDRTTAVECAKALLINMPRTCQAGFAVLPLARRHADEPIRRAEEWIHRRYRDDFRFEALATELGMSPRNFIRRFKQATGLSPVDYLQQLRVQVAKRIIEEGWMNVQEVGCEVGYSDAAFFRDLFKRHTGLTPAAYRRQFGSSAVV